MTTLPTPTYAGTAVTTTATFTIPPSATPVDPSTVVLKYQAGSAAPVVWTYLGTGSIVKVATGVYSAELDTTSLAGEWTVEWIGTGACAAVSVSTFPVQTPPL